MSVDWKRVWEWMRDFLTHYLLQSLAIALVAFVVIDWLPTVNGWLPQYVHLYVYKDDAFYAVAAVLVIAILFSHYSYVLAQRWQDTKTKTCMYYRRRFSLGLGLTIIAEIVYLWVYPAQEGRKITILTSKTKRPWLQTVVNEFNHRNLGVYYVELLAPRESREGMLAIREAAHWPQPTLQPKGQGRPQQSVQPPQDQETPLQHVDPAMPTIFSPSRSLWLVPLIQIGLSEYDGKTTDETHAPVVPLVHLQNTEGGEGNRVYTMDPAFCYRAVTSPIAVITPANWQTLVFSVFRSTHPWTDIGNVSPKDFFAVADPYSANSGSLVVFMMLKEFKRFHPECKTMVEAATSKNLAASQELLHSAKPLPSQATETFDAYLSRVFGKHKRYNAVGGATPSEKSWDLFDRYTQESSPPAYCLLSYESFIDPFLQERSPADKPDFVKVTINDPTTHEPEINDHPFVVLNASWVSEIQKRGAVSFLDFMHTINNSRYVDDANLGGNVTSAPTPVGTNDHDLSRLKAHLARFHFNQPYGPPLMVKEDDYYGQNAALDLWYKFQKAQQMQAPTISPPLPNPKQP